MKTLFSFLIFLFFSGCSAIGKIENNSISQPSQHLEKYNSHRNIQRHPTGDILLLLAFSGGGTRAAALSYGVLEELRDTHYLSNTKEIRLLDEVDRISSVSGGSFTSAYYGLFGDQIFDDFKDVFLYKNVQGDLSSLLLGFFNLIEHIFSTTSRTEIAIDYYDKHIFKGKTFADLEKSNGPAILINASDLNSLRQFTFIQRQFDFLCSDLSSFKISRAVAASSAVPLLFQPVLLRRYDDCFSEKPGWLSRAEEQAIQEGDPRLKASVEALNFYLDKDNPPYVTLLDGGITDNLGLRSILTSVNISGGAQKIYDRNYQKQKPPKQLVVIVVNASTVSDTHIGESQMIPSIGDTLSAVTDIQLHLYNTETNILLKEQLMQWANKVSTVENPITPYFIDLNVTGIENKQDKIFFNQIPTNFSLEKYEADKLIELARELLRNNPEYKRLLHQLEATNSHSTSMKIEKK